MTALFSNHVGQNGRRAVKSTSQIDRENTLPLDFAHVGKKLYAADCRIIDQNIYRAEMVGNVGNHSFNLVFYRNVYLVAAETVARCRFCREEILCRLIILRVAKGDLVSLIQENFANGSTYSFASACD